MIALLDGDIFAFRCASASETEHLGIARARVDEMVERCLASCQADEFKMFLSGVDNFRYTIYPQYKANRTAPKPRHLEPLREYLVKAWDARLTEGYEADDALGIAATADSIICSIDKDLLQIPGHHWNFVKDLHTVVTPEEGLCTFYRQMLIGDTSDNVPGVAGIGKVKAALRIRAAMSERAMFSTVRSLFLSDEAFCLTGDLIYILREEGERWSEKKKNWMSDDISAPAEATKSESIGPEAP